jgi:MATE family multidrug resistance protein
MTGHPDIREQLTSYMPWMVATPLIGVLAFVMDGVFIGATWTRDMRRTMLVAFVVFMGTYYSLFPVMGNHGLWLAFTLFLLSRGVLLVLLLRRRYESAFFMP